MRTERVPRCRGIFENRNAKPRPIRHLVPSEHIVSSPLQRPHPLFHFTLHPFRLRHADGRDMIAARPAGSLA